MLKWNTEQPASERKSKLLLDAFSISSQTPRRKGEVSFCCLQRPVDPGRPSRLGALSKRLTINPSGQRSVRHSLVEEPAHITRVTQKRRPIFHNQRRSAIRGILSHRRANSHDQ